MDQDEDDDDIPAPPPDAAAGWIMTFADLMSLLMCFFVLLLSFSEMDLKKFKQLAGSVDFAFGVQRKIRANEIPRGTSVIAREFTPGKPDPTPFNEITQKAMDSVQSVLLAEAASNDKENAEETTRREVKKLSEHLLEELRAGKLQIETVSNKIVIRLLEEATFPSGSADLRDNIYPVIQKIGTILVNIPGAITVAGFTDNVPISTDLFASNWSLSASRAVAVVNELAKNKDINTQRLQVTGFGETRPLVPNNTYQNRAKNRRVEIIVSQGEQHEYDEDELYEVEHAKTLDSDEGAEHQVDQFGGFRLPDGVPVEDTPVVPGYLQPLSEEQDLQSLTESATSDPDSLLLSDE